MPPPFCCKRAERGGERERERERECARERETERERERERERGSKREREREKKWLIARSSDNSFINSSWVLLLPPARAPGPIAPRPCGSWKWCFFLRGMKMEQPASLPPQIPGAAAGSPLVPPPCQGRSLFQAPGKLGEVGPSRSRWRCVPGDWLPLSFSRSLVLSFPP